MTHVVEKRIALLLKGVSGGKALFKLSITTLYYLYLNAYKTIERKKLVEITLYVIIAHHGWAAEQND